MLNLCELFKLPDDFETVTKLAEAANNARQAAYADPQLAGKNFRNLVIRRDMYEAMMGSVGNLAAQLGELSVGSEIPFYEPQMWQRVKIQGVSIPWVAATAGPWMTDPAALRDTGKGEVEMILNNSTRAWVFKTDNKTVLIGQNCQGSPQPGNITFKVALSKVQPTIFPKGEYWHGLVKGDDLGNDHEDVVIDYPMTAGDKTKFYNIFASKDHPIANKMIVRCEADAYVSGADPFSCTFTAANTHSLDDVMQAAVYLQKSDAIAGVSIDSGKKIRIFSKTPWTCASITALKQASTTTNFPVKFVWCSPSTGDMKKKYSSYVKALLTTKRDQEKAAKKVAQSMSVNSLDNGDGSAIATIYRSSGEWPTLDEFKVWSAIAPSSSLKAEKPKRTANLITMKIASNINVHDLQVFDFRFSIDGFQPPPGYEPDQAISSELEAKVRAFINHQSMSNKEAIQAAHTAEEASTRGVSGPPLFM